MNFAWLLPILLLLWSVWRLLHQCDLALLHVRRWCAREQLQLLDDNVSFMGWRRWPMDDAGNGTRRTPLQHFRLVQQFRFEVSGDGRERRAGRLLMHAATVLRLQVETADGHQLIEPAPAEQQPG